MENVQNSPCNVGSPEMSTIPVIQKDLVMVLDDWTSRVEWEGWTSGIFPLEAGVLEQIYTLS